jgi:ATP-dependent helicase/nuclease subunit B
MPVILYKSHKPITEIEAEILERIKKNQPDSFVYVVPTRRKVRELQRDLLRKFSRNTSSAVNIFTLGTFASRLHEIYCKPKLSLTPTTQAIIFAEAIRITENELKYFFPRGIGQKIQSGTLHKIINVINHLKESGIYPSLLYQELESSDSDEKQKLKDILLIYQQYESILSDKFIDAGGIFKEINDTLSIDTMPEKFKHNFPNVNSIFVAGFDEFSDPEITMINTISKMKDIGLIISFDYFLNNDELFGHLRENFEKFLSLSFKTTQQRHHETDNFRSNIVRNLFSNKKNNKFFNDNVTILQAYNREKEVEYIAKLIKQIAADNPDVELSKICIAMYQPQIYTKLFHEIFPRYGIPANITDRFALDQAPLIVSIISLLNIWQNHFRLRDIMRAFSSPYFKLESDGSAIDINNLYSVATSLKIRLGRRFWEKRINERLKQIEIERLDIDDQFENDILQREFTNLHKALKDISEIENLLKCFSSDKTPVEFQTNLLNILNILKVSKNILGDITTGLGNIIPQQLEQIEKDARAYQSFLNVVDELLVIYKIQNKSSNLYPLKYVTDQLKSSISQTRYNIRQKHGYGVYVTSLEETRGLEFEYMFIAGLVDGEFPPAYQPEIFLSHSRQSKKENVHLTENRYLFYQGITNFSKKLFISFPKKEDDKEIVPSSFIDAFLKIIECNDRRTELPAELLNNTYSEEDFIKYLGNNTDFQFQEPLENKLKLKENVLTTIRHMFDAIRIEREKLEPDKRPEYKGMIFNNIKSGAQKHLENTKNKTYSISQLEKYAGCPFKYFLDQVLYLNVVEEMEEGITPLEKGTILHEILFNFYSDRRKNNLPPLFECTEDEFQGAVDKLMYLTQEKINALPESDLFTFLEKELILGTSATRGIIHEFLDHERNRKLDVKPSYFEVPIGKRIGKRQNTDSLLFSEENVQVGKNKIRGKVDRIDVSDKHFTIIDYKTGSDVPTIDDIKSGLSLQLPIYLYAVETLIDKKLKKKLSPAAGLYYVLKSPVKEKIGLGNVELDEKAFHVKRKRKGFVDNETELRTLINESIKFVDEYIQAISQGQFQLADEEKMQSACKYCDFYRICRKQTFLME